MSSLAQVQPPIGNCWSGPDPAATIGNGELAHNAVGLLVCLNQEHHTVVANAIETVARNRGVLLKVATEREEATQWLDSQPTIGLGSGKAAAGA